MQTPWADRLFQRLAAIYGHQKLATMFADDSGEVRATWEEQLRRFKPEVLRRAIQSVIDGGSDWPPTLAQFVGICRDHNRGEQASAPALPPPSPTDLARAAEQIGQIAGALSRPADADRLSWARVPRSEHAVRLLLRGAEHDQRLRDILREHLADDGARCETALATAEVAAIKANPPSFMRSRHVAI